MSQAEFDALEYLRSAVDPRSYHVAPPTRYGETSFNKSIDISGNFLVDDTGLVDEQVPTRHGVIVELTMRGIASIVRIGIVPAQTTRAGIKIGTVLKPAATDKTIAITYMSKTPLPYRQNGLDQVTISPYPQAAGISAARKYAGVVSLMCDTVPVGTPTLGGYFSGGAIADTRDVSRTGSGNSFDAVDLVQSSLVAKDGVKEIGASRGITSIHGPDISNIFMPPDLDYVDQVQGLRELGTCQNAKTSIGDLGWTTDFAGVPGISIYQGWYSAYNTQVTQIVQDNAVSDSGVISENVMLPVMNLAGTYTFDMTFNEVLVKASTTFTTYEIQCQFVDVLASVNGANDSNPGSVTYFVENTSESRVFYTGSVDQPHFGVHFKHEVPYTMYGQRGSYLGTLVLIHAFNRGAALPPVAGGRIQFGFLHRITIARNLYSPGELGPARVLRWDGMPNGQVIRLDGRYNVQAIPTSALAPFTKTSTAELDSAYNLHYVSLLSAVFNGKGPVKRIWATDDYTWFVRHMDLHPSVTFFKRGSDRLALLAELAGINADMNEDDQPKSKAKGPPGTRAAAKGKYDLPVPEAQPVTLRGPNDVSNRLRDLDRTLEPVARARAKRERDLHRGSIE